MIIPIPVREVKNVAFERANRSIDFQRLVNEVAVPLAEASIVESNLAVGIPARMFDPAAQIKHASRHGERSLFVGA